MNDKKNHIWLYTLEFDLLNQMIDDLEGLEYLEFLDVLPF